MNTKTAEWNYLMGTLHLKKGWHDSAYNFIRKPAPRSLIMLNIDVVLMN